MVHIEETDKYLIFSHLLVFKISWFFSIFQWSSMRHLKSYRYELMCFNSVTFIIFVNARTVPSLANGPYSDCLRSPFDITLNFVWLSCFFVCMMFQTYLVQFPPFFQGPYFFFFLSFFWLCCMACIILVPWPGIEPRPLAVKAWGSNHWTTREFPLLCFNEKWYLETAVCALGVLIATSLVIVFRPFQWSDVGNICTVLKNEIHH